MTKEEYAELYYLLGKLKYCFAESVLKSGYPRKEYDKIRINIDNILTGMLIIDNKKKTGN